MHSGSAFSLDIQLDTSKCASVYRPMDSPTSNKTLQYRTNFNRVHRFRFRENQRNQESKGQQEETNTFIMISTCPQSPNAYKIKVLLVYFIELY